MTLNDYFLKASSRLPEEVERVLKVLQQEGEMNKESLSLSAGVKRAVLDHLVMQLYALGFIQVKSEGKSRMCGLTPLGQDYLELIYKAG
ncbi:MAG: transcriptional regulator [Firmicutes bacterium]|nr:transcriptional regulator [Bacillota bacterium]